MDEAADGSQQPNSVVSCGHTDDLSNSDGGSVGAGPPVPCGPRPRLCLVGRLSLDPSAGRAAAALGLPVLLHESAAEALADCAPHTYYVLEDFAGPAFDMLYKAKQSILGPTALQQLSAQPDCQLPEINRPLYCLSMKAAVICFTGFRVKEELTHLITLIHHMGGSIRKDMSARVTHLIANCCGGEKYRYATAFRVPVVSRTWVDYCWEQRAQTDCRAADEAIVSQHKLKVFLGARVCFVGFPEEEHQHMTDILLKNGGETAALGDTNCSHVVMANGGMYDRSIPFSPTPNPTPDGTTNGTDENTFNELMKLLSPQIKRLSRKSVDLSPSLRGTTQNAAVNVEELSVSKFSSYKLETMSPDGLKRLSEHMLLEKSDNNDSYTNGCGDNNKFDYINSVEDDVKKLKRRPIVDINESLLNISDLNNTVSSHCLLRLFSPEKDNVILPSMGSETNISISTTASSKKRSRNSAESNFDLELLNSETTNKATEENNWKSPFKRLKIKDSFRFKGKEKPVICKTLKKKKPKNDDANHDEDDKNNLTDYIIQTSTPSPRKDDDNISMCSISSTAKADRSFFSSSGLFDISFCSLRGGKTAKSVSKIRRSMKSLTASFRGERKKKYEKRTKDSESEDDDLEEKNKIIDTLKKSPKINENAPVVASVILDISPVESKTPLARISEYNELEGSNLHFQSSPLIFKTPMGKPKRQATPKAVVVSPYTTFSPNPSGARALAPKPDQSRARRHPGKQDRPNNVLNRSLLSVVDEQHTQSLPEANATAHVVKAEWFWASVQNEEAQDEKDYLFEDYLEAQASPSRRSSRGSLSSSASCAGRVSPPPGAPTPSSTPRASGLSGQGPKGRRKRKLRGPEAALHKRRSSVGDAVLLSLSGNLLDCTQSPDGKQSLLDEVECVSVSDAARKLMSPRQQVFMELLQTESNYVGILHTIVTMFKQPLEEMSDEDNGTTNPLLNNTELKIIFGNLLPIYEIHRRMLEELKWASYNWSEETSIGRIVYKYAQDLVKAYPPFVNFFENMKDMLVQCDREKPRFHAFLKICQTKPECGRQSLQELLIRPVQRLPSISLLLDDILKHTNKSNPDHSALEAALAGVREVMAHVNEDKRKTEGQLQMFDIYNEIDNCPAHLVSSHRSFVSRCEVVEISKDLSGRGDHLVLFLFTDVMEVCKKRSKVFNSKSPPVNGLHHAASRLGSGKPYRHVQLMPLSTVKRVIDIRESNECHKVFALMCRSNQELKEKLYSFAITDEAVDKTHFLKQLCRQMANTVCKADAEKFLACLDSHQLDIDTSDIALGTLSKAFKFASRTRLKVGRAFSFNKTPSKLKRAMSSMISPFGSTSNLTPASQLAQMRLASCNNINELGVTGGSNVPEVLVAPLSVQPTRKAKTASLSAGALRRL